MTRLLAALVVATLAAACGEPEGPGDGKSVVVVSVLPQKYIVDRLASDLVEVEVLIPPGSSPELYEPSIQQMRALESASIYLKVGHPEFVFESLWIDPLLENASGIRVVDSSEGLELVAEDPHVWLSPAHVERIARSTAGALAELHPDDRARIDASLESFVAEITSLDDEIRERLEPFRGRRFLVFHPAWGYFANAYGLVQLSVEQGHKDPNPRELARLLDEAGAEDVDVVFVQPQIDPARAMIVAEELDGRVVTLDPLAYDWAENLREVSRVIAEELGS